MENCNLEYKSDIPKKRNALKAEIVSFLNTDGGTIILGVDDNGNKLKNVELKYKEWEEIIVNWIMDAFYPDVQHLIDVEISDLFKIKIKKGDEKPYCYKDGSGFNHKGVYIRVGSTKQKANHERVRRLLMASQSHEFDGRLSYKQNLTFDYAITRFKEKDKEFDLKGLLLLRDDKQYNNAALLMSNQNPTVSKIVVFEGNDVSVFLHKKEFGGSLLRQIDDMLYYANLYNNKKIEITGKPARDEYYDIPRRALREAILNCYCHRDWTISSDIQVEFFDNRVRISSPGSLPDELTFQDIKEGTTRRRNKRIVHVLDKLGYVENYNSGVRRIFKEYEDFSREPEYNISESKVVVTLYNRNYKEKTKRFKNMPVPARRKKIVEIIELNTQISIEELARIFSISERTVKRDLSELKDLGFVEYVGSSRYGEWRVNKK